MRSGRCFPIGAELSPSGVSFRVWAPKRKAISLVINAKNSYQIYPLEPEGQGYFTAHVANLKSNTLYRFQLDEDKRLYPDPASRFQPFGPEGPSQVIDPTYNWTDQAWKGIEGTNEIIYEIHIGTFTPEGTWASAEKELIRLAKLGITVVQLMPIFEFWGKFGWGYDGVNFFAPYHHYGTVDEVKSFVNVAHGLGIGVILDVVYNHLGAEGNYLSAFDENYFSKVNTTDWGACINFDTQAEEIRNYILTNAYYWVEEYHFDGYRFDATQNIFDTSKIHIIAAITQGLRQRIKHKNLYLIAENEQQQVKLLEPIEEGGYGLDALCNDDFHHSAIVRMTGRNEAYYTDYQGKVQELLSAIKYGFLYQGQWYEWQEKFRGTPVLTVESYRFIHFLQNHDQVANHPLAKRIHQVTDPSTLRVMSALLLLSPQTPLIFQGQEFSATNSFYYFSDHSQGLRELAHKGRVLFCEQFYENIIPDIKGLIPDPAQEKTFIASKINSSDRLKNNEIYCLYEDLLKLRRSDSVLSKSARYWVDGAILDDNAFVIRYTVGHDTRLLMINLGVSMYYSPSPEPLLAPPPDCKWEILWTSEDPRYGGQGILKMPKYGGWHLTGKCLVVLMPQPFTPLNEKCKLA